MEASVDDFSYACRKGIFTAFSIGYFLKFYKQYKGKDVWVRWINLEGFPLFEIFLYFLYF